MIQSIFGNLLAAMPSGLLGIPSHVSGKLPLAEITAPAQPHGDTIPILLMLFCVVLGVIIVCRSARRSAEIKLDDLDDE